MNIPKKRKIQQIAHSNTIGINSKEFIKIKNNLTPEPYSFLATCTNLPSSNSFCYQKKTARYIMILKKITPIPYEKNLTTKRFALEIITATISAMNLGSNEQEF